MQLLQRSQHRTVGLQHKSRWYVQTIVWIYADQVGIECWAKNGDRFSYTTKLWRVTRCLLAYAQARTRAGDRWFSRRLRVMRRMPDVLRFGAGFLTVELGMTQIPTVETLQRIGPDAGCDLTARTMATLSYKTVRGRGTVITRIGATVKIRRLQKTWRRYCNTLPYDARVKLGKKMKGFYDFYDMVEVAEQAGDVRMLRDVVRDASNMGLELHLAERSEAILRESDAA